MSMLKITLIAAACAAMTAPVFADDAAPPAAAATSAQAPAGASSWTPTFSFSGFGTIAATHNSNGNLDFLGNSRQPNGSGASTSSTSFGPDSLLAAQMNASLTHGLSGVVQVISQHQYDNTYDPAIEWAFLKYQATPNLDLSIGRTALPVFSLSDSRLIGYSNLWARTPIDVYAQVPLTSIDGVGASWRHETGLGQLTLQGGYGSTDVKFPRSTTVKGKNLAIAAATLESGDFTWRAAYMSTKLHSNSPSLDALTGAYGQYGDALASLGQAALAGQAYSVGRQIALDGRLSHFIDFGVSYDKGNWVAQAEWTARKSASLVPNTKAWDATVGYRWGDFTPFVGVSQLRTTSNMSAYPALTVIGATAAQLNGAAQAAFGSTGIAENSKTAGVKWNFHSNMDLKVQYDDARFRQGTVGVFSNPSHAAGNTHAGVATAAVDFVF